ncbi:[acyl-carrier-protein] S-malonyltransferase [Alteromonas sediminis]|uniref:Malonyl CoA-acyl carrier protein transacylase n=1 Tax=Alteromonas sediminis TaxID=2259342 RepID=A0A3N5Y425_9ALTE|nr:ACP S-malonyltransferase [Alteromonas sediminis]RPJ67666.1 [acyl-carrier-protein] S-malonyltransferase [Alteromonas sediminis]
MNSTAFVFPGQGSQSKGMLAELAAQNESVKTTFDRASSILGYDLWQVVQEDSQQTLNQTQVTQPALLTSSYAIWQLLHEQGHTPAYMAGHSLGEYSALVCAGVMTLEDGVSLVKQRGEFMQQAVPAGEGAMYAIIGLADDKIEDICAQVQGDQGGVIAPVNYNSPGQVVIAGSALSAEKAAERCKEAGAKRALPLAVSVPSHCALMKPAADKLAEVLSAISLNTPNVPVINNVDVAQETDPEAIRSALIRQLYKPVQWTKTVETLHAKGITRLIEVGPGKVLTGLNKRIVKSLQCSAANTPDTIVLEN